jgi:hypothetical protein
MSNNYIYAIYDFFIKNNKKKIDRKNMISIILPLLVFDNKEIIHDNNILQKVDIIIQELLNKDIIYSTNTTLYIINELNQEYIFFIKTNELINNMDKITYNNSNLEKNVQENNKFYIIPSTTKNMKYEISSTFDYCSCPSFTYNQIQCKHLLYYENQNTNHLEYIIKEKYDNSYSNDSNDELSSQNWNMNIESNEDLEINNYNDNIINTYIIPSMSSNQKYNLSTTLNFCTCPYFLQTNHICKHIKYYSQNTYLLENLEQEELEII